jgi:uncharacterized membrane protein HdeD (DUF308 family)
MIANEWLCILAGILSVVFEVLVLIQPPLVFQCSSRGIDAYALVLGVVDG